MMCIIVKDCWWDIQLITSVICTSVTWSHWEKVRVIRPDFKDSQILKLSRSILWPSDEPESNVDSSLSWCDRCSSLQLHLQTVTQIYQDSRCLQTLLDYRCCNVTILGTPHIAVEMSGKHAILFGHPAVIPRYCSYYTSIHNLKTHVFSMYSHLCICKSLFLCMYTAFNLYPEYLD